MGDEINILNSDVDNQTSDFLDTMYSNSFFPTIKNPKLTFQLHLKY